MLIKNLFKLDLSIKTKNGVENFVFPQKNWDNQINPFNPFLKFISDGKYHSNPSFYFYPLMCRPDNYDKLIDINHAVFASRQSNVYTILNLDGTPHSQLFKCVHPNIRPYQLFDVWVFRNVNNEVGDTFDEVRVAIPVEQNTFDLQEIVIFDKMLRNLDFNGNIISKTENPILQFGNLKIKQANIDEMIQILEFIKSNNKVNK